MDKFSPSNPYEESGERPPRTIKDAARELKSLQAEQDTLEETAKGITKKIEWLRYSLLPRMFEDEGVEKVRYDDIGLIYIKPGLRASIPAEKKETAWTWLKDNGHANLITETVNAQSLSAAMNHRFKNGKEIPENIFRVYAFQQAVITK